MSVNGSDGYSVTSDRESLDRCRADLCGIYGGRSRSGKGFRLSTSAFNRQ
jgi:hypothetical protein